MYQGTAAGIVNPLCRVTGTNLWVLFEDDANNLAWSLDPYEGFVAVARSTSSHDIAQAVIDGAGLIGIAATQGEAHWQASTLTTQYKLVEA